MKAALILLLGVSAILVAVAAYSVIAQRSGDELLDQIHSIQPGTKLDGIKSRLGYQMYRLTGKEALLHYGPVQNASFCDGKTLYIFAQKGLLPTALDVYTDENDVIVYVSWHTL
jgi:hypothetical protein